MNITTSGEKYNKINRCIICEGRILGRSCINCGNLINSDEYTLHGNDRRNLLKIYYKKQSRKIVNKIQDKTSIILGNKSLDTQKNKIKRFRIKYKNYQSYEIEIDNDGKIKNIKFYILVGGDKKEGFKISIKIFFIERKKIKERYGSNYDIVKISDLEVGEIGKKLKNGYEYKNKIKGFGLDFQETLKFIKEVLKQYHINNY